MSECEGWYCLLQVQAGHDGTVVGTSVLRGGAAPVQGLWRPVLDGERVTGHIELSYQTSKE